VSEIAGVQTQQTSQVSGSASIRIQGLEGKYTLLLQNGMPLYSGLASGLSILQIPPLNLKRVEVIKGASSTLYGGGAIAGLINLITKEPVDKREISFLINTNHTHALDLSSFYSEKYHKTGMGLYTTANFQKAYDVNKDGFSDIPKFNRYSINPSFYYYPNATTTFSFGIHAGVEKRTGGDMQVINLKADSVHSFYEINNTERYATEARFEKHFLNNNVLTLKNSVGFFNRKIARRSYGFEGNQIASFSEMNFLVPRERSELNLGINYISDHFKQMPAASNHLDYHDAVWGLFVQDNVKLSSSFIVETGLRLDFSNRNNSFLLPRLSLLYKITHKLTTRLGGGFGYKTPTIFSDEAEEIAFKNIEPLNFALLKPERSYGLNADLNYKSIIFEKLIFSVNQLFFYTIIKNPLLLNQVPATNNYAFENAQGNIESKGFETAIKLRVQDISCYIGYTYTDVKRYFNHVSSVNPVTAKHHLDIDLMYELNEKLRVGYELYYVGSQYSTTGEKLRSYWEMGLLSEYKFKHFSLFINFENLLDTRQSRWGNMYSGTMQDPQFKEVYAPTDGFILNTGVKLSL